MTQEERRRWLIGVLLEEDPQYQGVSLPADPQGQVELLRALMNLRPPRLIGQAFLRVQDAYLSEERARRGVVDGNRLPPLQGDSRLVLWQGDITRLQVDAIVNAANSGLLGCFHPLHGCIDNVIHSRSGVQLRLLCHKLMQRQGHEEPTGQAKCTPAFNLPSRYVLHTVGPIVQGTVTRRDRAQLAACYRACLDLAAEKGLESVAFCCISTGVFCFPNREAAEIAVQTVQDFLQQPSSIQKVIFNVYKDIDAQIYRDLLGPDGSSPAGP